MKPELEIGMPAMIIGCKRPENSYLIGTIVKIEAFWNKGDDITSFYIGAKESGTTVRCNTSAAVVSESKFTNNTTCGEFHMPKGWTNIDPKYLMPLPPLDDDAIIEATEKPKETTKC